MTTRGFRVFPADLAALVAWLAVVALAVVATAHPAVMSALTVIEALAAVLTLAAYCGRRFDRLEAEAFDRGLRAGMGIGGVPIMDQHRSS